MPTALIATCPLCGLRFSNRPLLELHIREDHRRASVRRKDRPARTTGARRKISQNPFRKWTEAAGIMAKALLGHASGPDPGMLSDIRRLRQRVRDLETKLGRMQRQHDVLAAAARQHAPAAPHPQPKAVARG